MAAESPTDGGWGAALALAAVVVIVVLALWLHADGGSAGPPPWQRPYPGRPGGFY